MLVDATSAGQRFLDQHDKPTANTAQFRTTLFKLEHDAVDNDSLAVTGRSRSDRLYLGRGLPRPRRPRLQLRAAVSSVILSSSPLLRGHNAHISAPRLRILDPGLVRGHGWVCRCFLRCRRSYRWRRIPQIQTIAATSAPSPSPRRSSMIYSASCIRMCAVRWSSGLGRVARDGT